MSRRRWRRSIELPMPALGHVVLPHTSKIKPYTARGHYVRSCEHLCETKRCEVIQLVFTSSTLFRRLRQLMRSCHRACREGGQWPSTYGWHSDRLTIESDRMSQDMGKLRVFSIRINPDDLPWRTLALYHVASSDICRWKGDLSTAERMALV